MPVRPPIETTEEARCSPSLEAVLRERAAQLLRTRRERAEAAELQVKRFAEALAVAVRHAEDLARQLA